MPFGQCLCGAVRFALNAEVRFFYRCHCSLCRRQSGVGHNAATLVNAADFRWLSGEKTVRSWRKPSGYRNDFCADCGSTVPNLLNAGPYVWVPIGLLAEDAALVCIGDFCVDDSMQWDHTRGENPHAGGPESLDSLLTALAVAGGGH
ncbi:GFA family protein [Gibbsiella dentisursi]